MAIVPSLQRLQRLFASELQTEESNDSRFAATQLPKIDSYGLPSPIPHPETQLNIAGSSKVPSREVRQANREVCHRKLPDRGEHGLQGRASAVGTFTPDRRLKRGTILSSHSTPTYFFAAPEGNESETDAEIEIPFSCARAISFFQRVSFFKLSRNSWPLQVNRHTA
jgi:hypothetical protein